MNVYLFAFTLVCGQKALKQPSHADLHVDGVCLTYICNLILACVVSIFAKTFSTFRTYRSYFLGVKLGHFIRISPAAIRSNFVRYLHPKLDHVHKSMLQLREIITSYRSFSRDYSCIWCMDLFRSNRLRSAE